ncbi:MAG: helix-turn-helix domain-containing protein [Moraxella sp.]|nr:helix-turn-helix domain-containing protein [Moraxella sp.]
MCFPIKYAQSFKLDVIAYYKQGYSYHQTAKCFNIASHKTVEAWVKLFDSCNTPYHYLQHHRKIPQ